MPLNHPQLHSTFPFGSLQMVYPETSVPLGLPNRYLDFEHLSAGAQV